MIKNTFKTKNSIIKVIFVLLLSFFLCIGLQVYENYKTQNKSINLEGLNTKLYIKAADDASQGKLQANWKYMAAIDGVRYKNDFSKTTDESLGELANMFIEENSTSTKIKNNKYRLVSLDNVLDKLSFSESQKEKVYKYIDDLKYTGTEKNTLNDASKLDFIQDLYPQAVEIYDECGILPSITISQAILESGWGKSDLSTKAKNLFGIKADASWKGEKIKMNTSEYYNTKISDNFRVYDSNEESLKDYGEFLSSNKRYKENGVFDATQYLDQAKAIQNSGYSTVENSNGQGTYAQLLTGIIQEQNLQLLDFQCEMNYFENN